MGTRTTHMGVPTAVSLGLCVVGIHLTCQGWRGEKVRGSQHAYWVFQKQNRDKIWLFRAKQRSKWARADPYGGTHSRFFGSVCVSHPFHMSGLARRET